MVVYIICWKGMKRAHLECSLLWPHTSHFCSHWKNSSFGWVILFETHRNSASTALTLQRFCEANFSPHQLPWTSNAKILQMDAMRGWNRPCIVFANHVQSSFNSKHFCKSFSKLFCKSFSNDFESNMAVSIRSQHRKNHQLDWVKSSTVGWS